MRASRLGGFSLGGREYYDGALEPFLAWLLVRGAEPRVIQVANVHTHISALWDRQLAQAQAEADLILPDGRPLSLAAKLMGWWQARQLRGPDLMVLACKRGAARGTRHFFYGGTKGVAAAVAKRMKKLAPGAVIAGALSPPFRPVSDKEVRALAARLRRLKVDLLWVGLGAPKQEILMRRLALAGAPCAMLGVGAAFDYYAGAKPEAPKWMQGLALEWIFRLAQEPGRLWKRYLSTNPAFVGLVTAEYFGLHPSAAQAVSERLLRLACLTGLAYAFFQSRPLTALLCLAAAAALGRLYHLAGKK